MVGVSGGYMLGMESRGTARCRVGIKCPQRVLEVRQGRYKIEVEYAPKTVQPFVCRP